MSAKACGTIDEEFRDGGGLGQGESWAHAHEDDRDGGKESLELHACFGGGVLGVLLVC